MTLYKGDVYVKSLTKGVVGDNAENQCSKTETTIRLVSDTGIHGFEGLNSTTTQINGSDNIARKDIPYTDTKKVLVKRYVLKK